MVRKPRPHRVLGSLAGKKRLAPDIERQRVLPVHARHAEILALPGSSHLSRALALHKLLGVARVATLVHGDVEHHQQPYSVNARQPLLTRLCSVFIMAI